MLDADKLLRHFDPATGEIAGAPVTKRYLSDLKDCFADRAAYASALARGNPLLYTVASVATADGAGDLHYGVGKLMPGRIGSEYFMTRGHLHAWRDAAEIYVGLAGEGVMLLQDIASGESRMIPLRPQSAVYVPGGTAHRTINTGHEPLTYLGVYPAAAGHDYVALAQSNFNCVVLDREGQPVLLRRKP